MKTISNEEKAKEIAKDNREYYYEGDIGWGAKESCSEEECYESALQAMEWKDEKIDTIMLTTEGCLRSFFESQGNTQESIDNFIDALKTQINENLNKL
jgi:hypothetical protein